MLLATFAWLSVAHQGVASNRIALVVGNADYQQFGTLPTPIADAKLMSETLSGLGFQVDTRLNLKRSDLKTELANFIRAARLADVALIYYSGYQLSLNGQSYLIPIGEAPTSINEAKLTLINVEAMLGRFNSTGAQNIFVLESGWSSPIVKNLADELQTGQVESLQSSIAVITVPEPQGSLLAISATVAGKLNPTEQEGVSKFTSALASDLSVPGKSVTQAVTSTADSLVRQTAGRQSPLIKGALAQQLYLAGKPIVVPWVSEKDKLAQAQWRLIADTGSSADFLDFLNNFGDTAMAEVALNRIIALNTNSNLAQLAQEPQAVDLKGLVLSPEDLPQVRRTDSDEDHPKGQRSNLTIIPELGYKVQAMEQEFVTLVQVDLRELPWQKSLKVGQVESDTRIVVTGAVKQVDWFRVRWGEGRDLYVKGSEIRSILEPVAAVELPTDKTALPTETKLIVPSTTQFPIDFPSIVGKIINVQTIIHEGRVQETLTASLMQKFGSTVKTEVTNQREILPDTVLDVSGRLISVQVREPTKPAVLALDLINSGAQVNKVDAEQGLKSYTVTVELFAKVIGEDDPIVGIDAYELEINPDTDPKIAVSIASKRAFDRAADQILSKLDTVFNQ